MNVIIINQESVSDTEFTITEIFKNNEDFINKGDLLFAYETSKADIEIESPFDGYLLLNIKVGDKVKVGQKVAFISEDQNELKKQGENLTFLTAEIQKPRNFSKKALNLIRQNNLEEDTFREFTFVREQDVINYLSKKEKPIDIEEAQPNDLIIVGARGGSKMVIDAVNSTNQIKVKYLLDDSQLNYTSVFGKPIIGGTKYLDELHEKGYRNIFLAFGTISNRYKRLKMYYELKNKGWIFPNIIHKDAILEQSISYGEGNLILSGAIVGSDVKMGDFNFLNTGSILSHECVLQNNVHLAPGAVLAGRVSIGDNSLIGMNTTIYFDVNIGSDVTINNGITINRNINSNTVIKNEF